MKSLIVLLLLVGIGCAGVNFAPAAPKTDGIRYYRPTTYFLVKPDYKTGTASVTVFPGPDTCQVFAAKPYAVMANNTTALEFDAGILKSVSTNSDATAVPAAVVQAATALGKEALAIAAEGAKTAAKGAVSARAGGDGPTTATSPPPILLFVSSGDGVRQIFPAPATTTCPASCGDRYACEPQRQAKAEAK